jgi:hypothetical protein
VTRRQYHKLLDAALTGEGHYDALPLRGAVSGADALRLVVAQD